MFKMILRVVLCFTLMCQALVVKVVDAEAIYKEECKVWENVTKLVEHEPRLNVTCVVNRDCTGFDCKGLYIYSGILAGHDAITRSVCFGVFLRPCSDPKVMTVYIEAWEESAYNVSFIKNVTHDRDYNIDGLHETIDVYGVKERVNAKLSVEFKTEVMHGKPFAKIKMDLIPTMEHVGTLQGSEVKMVPEIDVPIPACNPSVHVIEHIAYKCPNITASKYIPPAAAEFLPGNNCTVNDLHQCGDNQQCQQKDSTSKAGLCVCTSGYEYSNSTATCQASHTEYIIDDGVAWSTKAPHDGSSHKHNSSIGIVVGSVVAVFVIAIVVVLILFKNRRRIHRRFRANEDQEQILNQTQDEDPIEL